MFDGQFNQGTDKPRKKVVVKKNLIMIVALVLLAVILVASAIYVVPAGNIAVITRFGAVNRVAYPGMNLRLPFAERVVLMSIRTQKDQVGATAMSKNLQVVTSDIAVNYHLDGTRATEVFQNIGTNYSEIIVAPAVQNTFKAVTAKFTAEELITNRD